ncbi:molybdopterin molybdotransferase MoeA [Yoonia sp. 208BN28-4]|uniref:molybdopterin molybdotransferase MoeA n=1 Tax=Yoonia sp. 208BN28-4 TaxID=3126505 RepID=UPI0030B0CFBB
MISVAQALTHLFDLVRPLETETVRLHDAAGRVLAQDAVARRDQPPFAASSMDGYAVHGDQVTEGAAFTVVGEAAAGHALDRSIAPHEAARIFTGAPMPTGTDRVVIQEDVTRDGDTITVNVGADTQAYVREQGKDFKNGDSITAPRLLSASDVALLAAMNIASVTVTRRPKVAIIATGDELVQPGEAPGPDQIIASNSFGLAALMQQHGADVRHLPIARDTLPSLRTVLDLAKDADLILTIGGASEGDHDLVAEAATKMGLDRSFYKIAMRPGKPLMAGTLGTATLIGLPGNPVSAMVCGHIFVLPALRKMMGLPAEPAPTMTATLAAPVGQNGPREHYMRGILGNGSVTVFEQQDSVLLSLLSQANCLVIRPPHDPERAAGDTVTIVQI